MIIKNQKVKIKWNPRNKIYYENKGYVYTKMGDEFEVKVEELSPGNTNVIYVKCDLCNQTYTTKYHMIYNNILHYCKSCKMKQTNLEKYGVENVFGAEIIKEKIQQTNLKRHGIRYPAQSKEIKEKMKQTNLEKYGVENVLQNRGIFEKMKQTNLKRYGVENVFQAEKIKKIIKQTTIDKYGVENVSQSEKIKKQKEETCLKNHGVKYIMKIPEIHKKNMVKAHKTMHKNSKAPCTKPQKYIYDLLNNIQPCKLNYPVDTLWLDIAYPEEMIYIEYDGGGHDKRVFCGWQTREDFDNKEIKRQYFLKNKGWKLIRIISKTDLLPNDTKITELILECKNHLLTTNCSWMRIDFNENKIKCKKFEKDI